ncbi:MAG TPA: AAA family ATPase [Rugosimonospora sp.]|nr:AAA family ATPase [Rugosimonospora sp.]
MARRENPIDAAGGALAEFALRLRKLRHAAGRPTYRQMAARAHISGPALSKAASGQQVPTWSAVHAYLRACNVTDLDVIADWRRAWDTVRQSAADQPVTAAGPSEERTAGMAVVDAAPPVGPSQVSVDVADHGGLPAAPVASRPPGVGRPLPVRAAYSGYVARTAFVGRNDEIARLAGLLEQAARGVPATLLVRGEAGVGKSRLLSEFAHLVKNAGATVLQGSCIALGSGEVPYAPLIEALRGLHRSVGDDRVRDLAGTGFPELARLLVDFADPLPLPALAQARVFAAVLSLLGRLGEDHPVVLIIEDLHWADPSTLDLLAYLAHARTHDRLLLLGSYRTTDLAPRHPLRRLVAELDFARKVELLEVSRFGRRELKQFLGAATGSHVDHELVERTYELSDGNPFFVEELLASGVLARQAADGAPVTLPQSLRDVVLSRFELLSGDAREVMRVAATAGRQVSHGLLTAVCEIPERRMLDALRECVENQMLVADSADDTYVFRHALLREVVHQDLLPGERIRLHAAIAHALAADNQLSYAEQLSVAAELSYHWYEARAFPQSLEAAVRAGDAAARLLAFRDAGRQYDRVLAVWSRVDDAESVAGVSKIRLLASAANAARWAGRIERAVELARAAVSEIDSMRHPAQAGEMYERLGSYLWEAGDRGASEDAYGQAGRLLADAPPSATTARVLAVQARVQVFRGQFAEGLLLGRSALAMARAVGAAPESGRALNTIGLARAMLGEVDGGVQALRESIHIAATAGEMEDLFRAYGNLTFVLETAGRLEESVAVAREGLDRAQQTGLKHTRASSVLANNASAALVHLGRWDEATAMIQELLSDQAAAEGLFLRLTLAEIAVARGQFDTVDRILTDLGDGGAVRQPQFLGSLHACAAESAIWRGQYDVANAAVAEGLRALGVAEHKIVRLRLCAVGLRNEAEEWLRRSALPDTAKPDLAPVRSAMDSLAAQAERLADAANGPKLPEVDALLLLCRAEHHRIDPPAQAAGWAEVAAVWEALQRPYQTAYARWQQAEAAARCGPAKYAAVPARLAYQSAERLGAEPLRRNVLALAQRARLDLSEVAPDTPEPAAAEDPFKLTPRERQVLELICLGRSNRQIARELFIADKTAGVHVSNLLKKLQVRSRSEAAAVAHRLHLLGARASA